MARPISDPRGRFWANVKRTDNCWEWIGNRKPNGYGEFAVRSLDGWKTSLAHRFAYELLKGSIPRGLTIDHLCKNRLCVNPSHMEIVTLKVNILRGNSPWAINARKTHCLRGHPLIEGNLVKHRNSTQKDCLTCHREKERARRASFVGIHVCQK